MDPFSIAALVAMVAGAGMQYKASNDAAKRQAAETRAALARQAELQKQAEAKAMGQAKEFNTNDRAAAQDQIAQELTQEFIKPVESAQQINAAQSTTQGAVSNDYTTAKAKSNAETMKAAEFVARLLGKTTAAGRLRNNEAIRMADTAAGIDRLGNFSRGQAGADQIAIQAAGRPDAGMQLAGGLLSAAGSAGMSGAFNGANTAASGSGVGATASTSGSVSAPIASSTTGGIGFTGAGRVGARIPASFVW